MPTQSEAAFLRYNADMNINEIEIVILSLIAALACIAYSRVRFRRRLRAAWGLMSIPCFEYAILYSIFYFFHIPIVDRAQPSRWLLVSLFSFIIFIAGSLAYHDRAYINRGTNSPRTS